MASAEEVQSLKREVEMLKLMLEQERTRSSGGSAGELSARASQRLPSPTRALQQQQEGFFPGSSKPYEDDSRREPTPRRPVTAATSPSRGKTLRWKDSTSSQHQQPPHLHGQATQSAPYTQFVRTDTKRGKWWLKDRQILSRNVPAPNDHSVAMKVREIWQWSGRTVVVDKIVTGPRPRDDQFEDGFSDREFSDHRVRDLQDEAARYREELRRIGGSTRSVPTSPTVPLSSTSVAALVAFHDSKQLAKEFIQPRPDSSAAVEELAGTMRTASQRMEAQMAQAITGTSEGQPALDVNSSSGGSTARGAAEPSSLLLPQLSPSKSAGENNLPVQQ